jgi:hypothetical protein
MAKDSKPFAAGQGLRGSIPLRVLAVSKLQRLPAKQQVVLFSFTMTLVET